MQRSEKLIESKSETRGALEAEFDALEASIEQILAEMESGLEISSDDATLSTRDKDLPFLFSEDLAGSSVQGDLVGISSADGRTQDISVSWGQSKGSFLSDALPESTGDVGSARHKSNQRRYPIRERVAAPPVEGSRTQPAFALAQSNTSSANNTTSYGTKANSSGMSRKLRTLAPLPATSPFILISQSEDRGALRLFPTNSPLILRSQPEKMEKGGGSGVLLYRDLSDVVA